MSDEDQPQTKLPEMNYTQAPNLYFALMPVMSEPEMKVMGAAIRNICGFHKTAPEPMAHSWFINQTGLSKNAVKKGIAEAINRGWLAIATEPTQQSSTEYILVFEDTEMSRNDPRKEIRGSFCDPHEMTPQKKEIEKKEIIDTNVSIGTAYDDYLTLIKEIFPNGGKASNHIANMLRGRSKTGKYAEYNQDNPVTYEELQGFASWYKRKYPEQVMVGTPQGIDDYIGRYREAMAAAPPPPPPAADTEPVLMAAPAPDDRDEAFSGMISNMRRTGLYDDAELDAMLAEWEAIGS